MKKIMFNDRHGLTAAVLRGEKTQTRRCIPHEFFTMDWDVWDDERTLCVGNADGDYIDIRHTRFAQYKVGEIVAIAQRYKKVYDEMGLETTDMLIQPQKWSKGWNNKMFVKADLMPHRIRITNVRCERLQDISDEDCLKEGIRKAKNCGKVVYGYNTIIDGTSYTCLHYTPREAFAALIDKVCGKGTWESNPLVWVYDFEVIF